MESLGRLYKLAQVTKIIRSHFCSYANMPLIYFPSKSAAGMDYVIINFSSEFIEGTLNGAEACATVTLLEDQVYEKEEIFTLLLESEDNVNVLTPVGFVELISNDGK